MSDSTSLQTPFLPFGDVDCVPLTRFQKIVARTITQNSSSIPHVTHHDEIDITELQAARRTIPAEQKITPLIFLIKATAIVLQRFPSFNASLAPDGNTLVLKKYFNIGIAVDGPLGLLVAVLRNCDAKDIPVLASELRDLSQRARTKGLPIDAMAGGSFTISSLGHIGGTAFTPIINSPEVAILGVSKVRTKPLWTGSTFEPREMLPLSLSYDHRVINGADAARFIVRIDEALLELARTDISAKVDER